MKRKMKMTYSFFIFQNVKMDVDHQQLERDAALASDYTPTIRSIEAINYTPISVPCNSLDSFGIRRCWCLGGTSFLHLLGSGEEEMVEIRSWLPLEKRLSHFSFSREQFQKLSDLMTEICFALIISIHEEDRAAVSFDVCLGGKPDAHLSISRCGPSSFDLNVNIEKSEGENVVLPLFRWFALSSLLAQVFSLAGPNTERRGSL
jgi:hypothetical protein